MSHTYCGKKGHNQHLIRFGIMCDGISFQKWQVSCIKKLLAINNVQLTLLIINKANPNPRHLFHKLGIRLIKQLFLQFYSKFFGSNAIRKEDINYILRKVPSISCKVYGRGKSFHYFTKADIQTIKEYDLDFILKFGFGIIRGAILKVARYGIWSYHHDEQRYLGVPLFFWEIYKSAEVVEAKLLKFRDRPDTNVILKRGFFKTKTFSYIKNVDTILYESANWPAQVCKDILNGNSNYTNTQISPTDLYNLNNPNIFQILLFAAKIITNFLTEIHYYLFCHDNWNIGVVYEPIYAFLRPQTKPEIHWLPKPEKDKFKADPFGIAKNQKVYIFFEDFDYRYNKGNISSIELMNGASASDSKLVMDLPIHLSYPYIFEYQGEVYCIPETFQEREISLYKAGEFPDKWAKVTTLLKDIAALDSTVFQYKKRWWLTFTDQDEDIHLKLFVWYSSDLFGPWKPHAGNPVKIDIRAARPAGTPFMYNGELYRPAQDCSRIYGGRIIINRVIRLTPTEFEEEPAAVIEPFKNSPYPDGVHTIAAVGHNITLIDGNRLTCSKMALKHQLISVFTKMKDSIFKRV